ncbi:hypothetical protein pEaSNUABM54_00316 [Erwinia phage pEa_SNUABM_54]|nr:hypothetical protein pEaSNUABM54_00316 [Erwinia phage pEa_SNUABM_54]
MVKITELSTAIGQARLNPSLVQDQVYSAIEKATNGELDIVDPSTPFSLLMGTGIALHMASMEQFETGVRRQYPELAQTYEDLYYHMANVDYLDRFCTPALTQFQLALSKEEILQRIVQVPGTRIKKMVIPRNTAWSINGYTFSTLYPIVIRLMPYGGLEITYDNTIPSPISTIESNLVEYVTATQDNVDFIIMSVPVQQLVLTSVSVPVTYGSMVTQKYTLNDSYYYCRVWGKQSDGSWVEYNTTHSQQVFDVNSVTALLKVTDNTLEVSIPQIYITNKLIASELRVDIYTSKGAVNVDLSGFAPSNYTMTFSDPEETAADSVYSAPLGAFNAIFYYCSNKVQGGNNGLTFEQLRERRIHNANFRDTPITDAQLRGSLQRRGFDILKAIEDINSRTYLATKPMPAPETGKFATGIGCSVELFQTSIDSLSGYATVASNGDRTTIKPTTLFSLEDGGLRIVSDAEKAMILAMTPDVLVNQVNDNHYMYSPFHYVLDTSNNQFATRPYYLENPRITNRQFIEENETALLEVAPDTYTLEKTDTGYKLTVVTRSGDSWKALPDSQAMLQLAFQPEDDTGYAFMNGKLLPNKVNNERVYEFDITCEWDITPKHSLVVDTFFMFNSSPRKFNMPLAGNWDLLYVAANYDVYQLEKRALDLWMGSMILPNGSVAVSRHRFSATMGDTLDNTNYGLWSRARNVPGSERYSVWTEDQLAYYTQNVPKRDSNNNPVYTVANGKVVYHWEHKAGDPVIDPATGKQKVLAVAGAAKLDAQGKPIRIETRKTERQFDLFMLDGTYFFATDEEDVEYAKLVPKNIVEWIQTDMAEITKGLLENTKVYFYPKRTLGNSRIIVNDGREVSIPAGLRIHVTYHMSLVSYVDTELRATLAKNASKIISAILDRSTVAVSDMISQLTASGGNDIIGIKIDDIGPNEDISTYTALDDSTRCAIGRKLTAMPEGVLSVAEDLAFDYVNHQTKTVDKA